MSAVFADVEGWWESGPLFEAFAAYAGDDETAVPGAQEDSRHIASWHPAVALAVADWLDDEAEWMEAGSSVQGPGLALARAYLGESS